jgi:hypothetical protein
MSLSGQTITAVNKLDIWWSIWFERTGHIMSLNIDDTRELTLLTKQDTIRLQRPKQFV